MERASGILCHITSLPAPQGIGTLGRTAYRFIDFLHGAGQRYWQMRPIGPTTYGDSPYQSPSAFAGNPNFIDLDMLADEGLLDIEDYADFDWGDDPQRVDYQQIYRHRQAVLQLAWQRGRDRDRRQVDAFLQEQAFWLPDYALFVALKRHFDQQPWYTWPEDIRSRQPQALEHYRQLLREQVDCAVYIQYLFFKQFARLKRYAGKKGVLLFGDTPLYVALDSADVWAQSRLFCLDEQLRPTAVAGVPPDYFSATGQLWGNPLYRWEQMAAEQYSWWIERLRVAFSLFDLLRIDHFRGFAGYWSIPYGDRTAAGGHWEKGPGLDFFRAVVTELGRVSIVAEDLGVLTDDVLQLLEETGFPGMKVLEFAFGGGPDNLYLPHNHTPGSVVYLGTHDNDTLAGWIATAPRKTLQHAQAYLGAAQPRLLADSMLRAAWQSVCDLAIVQVQDLLGLGSEARMNTPSTASGNWTWRLREGQLTPALQEQLRQMTELYGRIVAEKEQSAGEGGHNRPNFERADR